MRWRWSCPTSRWLRERDDPPTVAPPTPAGDAGDRQRVLAGVVGGLGLVGLAAGIGFGARALVLNSDSQAGCTDDTLCTTEGLALRRDAQVAGAWSSGLLLGGVALVGAGVAIWVLAPDPSDGPRAAVAVRLGPGALGFGGAW